MSNFFLTRLVLKRSGRSKHIYYKLNLYDFYYRLSGLGGLFFPKPNFGLSLINLDSVILFKFLCTGKLGKFFVKFKLLKLLLLKIFWFCFSLKKSNFFRFNNVTVLNTGVVRVSSKFGGLKCFSKQISKKKLSLLLK